MEGSVDGWTDEERKGKRSTAEAKWSSANLSRVGHCPLSSLPAGSFTTPLKGWSVDDPAVLPPERREPRGGSPIALMTSEALRA